MRHRSIAALAAAALLLAGCSSRPREFTPMLAPPPAGAAAFDQAAFDRAYGECSQLLVAGKVDASGRLASAGAGAAAGGAAAVAGGATAAAVAGYGGLAVASATIVLLPFAVIGGAVGMAKAKRARKERAIKTAMTGCLAERGFVVTDWVRARR
ncbi:hypothetical protein [Sphingomonas mesophila]|uniref:hypothetical protein n=1 Tax=Sphingomonas mesophila TaxID=2303576 RepID=UPI000E56C199|nr:hypothetical protein [Sphingomonas mesophila]